MENLGFFSFGDGHCSLIQLVFTNDAIVIYEQSCDFDCEVRSFRSLAALEAVFQLGAYRAAFLHLLSPSVRAQPVIRRFDLTDVPRHRFRYAVEGAGLIQLYLDGIDDGVIYHSHYGHWNEAGARERSVHPGEDCDW